MKGLKILGVIFGALVITTLAIDASDTLSGKGGTLLAQLTGYERSVCTKGMINVPAALTFSCVDKYEASASTNCVIENPTNQFDTEVNLSKSDCKISEAEALPWRYINREQAAVVCARSGKRLPSAAEWYQFALGTPAQKCNVESRKVATVGTAGECASAAGVMNSVGNVWEWVADDVIDGVYMNRNLPETGYVTQVDGGGVATITTSELDKSTGNTDYFWSNTTGTYAMIRGGYYGSRADAGVFTVHAQTAPTFSGEAIGFRCVR